MAFVAIVEDANPLVPSLCLLQWLPFCIAKLVSLTLVLVSLPFRKRIGTVRRIEYRDKVSESFKDTKTIMHYSND